MATIKSYTDLEQSKKLAEILPLESADGFWSYHDKWYSEGDDWEGYEDYPITEPYLEYTRKENEWKEDKSDVPCWSLTALLNVLPSHIYDKTGRKELGMDKSDTYYNVFYENKNSYIQKGAYNPVDACVAMIEKLHELKML